MRAEIVTVGAGRHNEGIEASTSRILQGASWKRQRIVVLVPSAAMIPAKVALSLAGLVLVFNQFWPNIVGTAIVIRLVYGWHTYNQFDV